LAAIRRRLAAGKLYNSGGLTPSLFFFRFAGLNGKLPKACHKPGKTFTDENRPLTDKNCLLTKNREIQCNLLPPFSILLKNNMNRTKTMNKTTSI